MEINYDKTADAVYLKVGTSKVARTIKMEGRLLVDVDDADNIVGIEILDASSQRDLVSELQKSTKTGVPVEMITRAPMA